MLKKANLGVFIEIFRPHLAVRRSDSTIVDLFQWLSWSLKVVIWLWLDFGAPNFPWKNREMISSYLVPVHMPSANFNFLDWESSPFFKVARFVPYTCSETIRHRYQAGSKYWWFTRVWRGLIFRAKSTTRFFINLILFLGGWDQFGLWEFGMIDIHLNLHAIEQRDFVENLWNSRHTSFCNLDDV